MVIVVSVSDVRVGDRNAMFLHRRNIGKRWRGRRVETGKSEIRRRASVFNGLAVKVGEHLARAHDRGHKSVVVRGLESHLSLGLLRQKVRPAVVLFRTDSASLEPS